MAKRYIWGWPDGIPEGSDFRLQAELTINGIRDTTLEGGTYVLNLRDANNSAATTILIDRATSTTDSAAPFYRVTWDIEDSISNGWAADSATLYHGDIRGTLADLRVMYWPVGLLMRPVLDT